MPDHFHVLITPNLFELDAFPQGLRPQSFIAANGAAEAAPFQSTNHLQENR
jgi:hypothetical protein